MAEDSYYWPPKFDPSASFIVAAWPKGFTVNGYQPKAGEPFDKSSVSERILREHYEKRWIKMVRPFAQLVEIMNAPPVKRGRGRPRKYPKLEASA